MIKIRKSNKRERAIPKQKIKKKRKIPREDQFGLGGSSDIVLEEGEKIRFSSKLSPWGFVIPIFVLFIFLACAFLINYIYLFVPSQVFSEGFTTTSQKVYGIIFGIIVVIIVAYIVHKLIRYRKFKLVITDTRIAVKEEYTNNIDIRRISTVMVQQNPFALLFNYGSLIISYTNGSVQTLSGLPQPNRAQRVINKILDNNSAQEEERPKRLTLQDLDKDIATVRGRSLELRRYNHNEERKLDRGRRYRRSAR